MKVSRYIIQLFLMLLPLIWVAVIDKNNTFAKSVILGFGALHLLLSSIH